jgi:hypothetical protein
VYKRNNSATYLTIQKKFRNSKIGSEEITVDKEISTRSTKKILFLTDFSPNENGYAGPQTAYNFIKLFEGYSYRILVNGEHYKEIKPSPEWKKNEDFYLFNYFFAFGTRNRLNMILNKVKSFTNPRIFFFKSGLINKLRSYDPDSIICIPNGAYNYKAGFVLKRKLPRADLFFYIMDDYKHYESTFLLKIIDRTFSKIKGWVSISHPLAQLFNSKYPSLKNKPYKIIQNPVSLSNLKMKEQKNHTNKVRLVYAGSVYSNHKETLLNIIDAINYNSVDIELSIYTKPEFREAFKNKESEKVIYKGGLNYKDLLNILPQFDYGLVTEAFLPEFENFARSSIQTKINDYLLSGCLPVVIGPEYGACVNHVVHNRLGYALTLNSKEAIVQFLEALSSDHNYHKAISLGQGYLLNELNEAKKNVTNFLL